MWQYRSDELFHHGVLGMKWGKRKSTYQTATGKKYSGRSEMHNEVSKRLANKKPFLSKMALNVSLDEKKLADRSQKNYEIEKESFSNVVNGKNMAISMIAGTLGGLAYLALTKRT